MRVLRRFSDERAGPSVCPSNYAPGSARSTCSRWGVAILLTLQPGQGVPIPFQRPAMGLGKLSPRPVAVSRHPPLGSVGCISSGHLSTTLSVHFSSLLCRQAALLSHARQSKPVPLQRPATGFRELLARSTPSLLHPLSGGAGALTSGRSDTILSSHLTPP